jgi:hypothetical protein
VEPTFAYGLHGNQQRLRFHLVTETSCLLLELSRLVDTTDEANHQLTSQAGNATVANILKCRLQHRNQQRHIAADVADDEHVDCHCGRAKLKRYDFNDDRKRDADPHLT